MTHTLALLQQAASGSPTTSAPPPPPDVQPPPPPPPAEPVIAPAPPGTAVGLERAFAVPVQQPTVPNTRAEVQALRERGGMLSDQLQSAQGRRDEVARELRRADGADQAGLEQRLQLLDQRIMLIESDIATNGRLLAAAPSNLLSSTAPARSLDRGDIGLNPGQMTAISIVFILFVLAPIALAYARRLFRRPVAAERTPEFVESQRRMERMEQAVDAIAIEVERVSESQRFLTRILTESRDVAAIGRGAAEPIRVDVAEAVGTSRP